MEQMEMNLVTWREQGKEYYQEQHGNGYTEFLMNFWFDLLFNVHRTFCLSFTCCRKKIVLDALFRLSLLNASFDIQRSDIYLRK